MQQSKIPYKVTFINSPNFSPRIEPLVTQEIRNTVDSLGSMSKRMQFVVFEQLTKEARGGFALTAVDGLVGIGLNSKLKNIESIVKNKLSVDLKTKIQSLQ